MIQVRLLLFAAFREALGAREMTLQVPAGTTVAELFDRVGNDHPPLRPLRPYATFAVNREVVAPETVLAEGDEVTFLQPVSGGVQ